MIHDWISSQFRELRGSYIRQLPIILAIKVLPETRPHCVDLPFRCPELEIKGRWYRGGGLGNWGIHFLCVHFNIHLDNH